MKTAILTGAALLMTAASFAQADNKTIVRQLYETVLNKRAMDQLPQYISPEYQGAGGQTGVPGFSAPVEALLRAFPDAQWTLKEVIAEGQTVCVHWQFTGTHEGPFQGIAPTHKKATTEAFALVMLKDGKVTSVHVLTDRLGFIQQLGAVLQLP
ncbi:ester cyclase [Chitinophaga lutea]